MSTQSFDDLIKGDSTNTTVVEEKKEPVKSKRNARKDKVVKTEPILKEVKEKETEEPTEPVVAEPVVLEVVEPVDEPDYALYYYRGEAKNFSAASLWFAFGYAIVGWPLLWLASQISIMADSVGFGVPKLTMFTFIGLAVLGVVAIVTAVIGFFTYKKRGYNFVPGIFAILLTVGTAVGTWLLFV